MSAEFIGPGLPRKSTNSQKGKEVVGSSLPSGCLSEPAVDIGPMLAPRLNSACVDESNDDGGRFGPALPPHLTNRNTTERNTLIGPQMPQEMLRNEAESKRDETDEEDELIGPQLPPSESSIDNEALIAFEIESRSKQMKDKLSGVNQPKKLEREKWMTELPPVLKGFGLGPRQFRVNPTDVGDRSVWTDTPEDKLQKTCQKKSGGAESVNPVHKCVQERDAEIAKQIANCEELEEKDSLLSMHEKARKRKMKEDEKSGKVNVRRPFDREVDLQVNRFDDAAKKRMIKQSQGLNSRFTHGSTSSTFL